MTWRFLGSGHPSGARVCKGKDLCETKIHTNQSYMYNFNTAVKCVQSSFRHTLFFFRYCK